MGYNKTNWQNLPSTNTPLNSINLNKIEDGIMPANTKTINDNTVNLNDFIKDGSYYFPGANQTITNIPAGVNGWLRVMESGVSGVVKQIWYRHGTANTNDFETYVRTCTDGTTWSNWTQIVTTNDELLIIRGTIPSTNLNDIQKTGIYYISDQTLSNAPDFNYSYSILIVIQTSVTHQYLIKPVSSAFYMREYSGYPAEWGSWKSVF